MAMQWAPGPFHLKCKMRVFLPLEVVLALVVQLVGVSEYGHYTAQALESLLHPVATNKAFSF